MQPNRRQLGGKKMKTMFLLTFVLLLAHQGLAQQPKENSWDAWRTFLGKWTAEGGGQPGQATAGGFSFDLDLQGRVLVRRSYSEYPATGSKPPFRHDDLMVIYQEPEKGTSAEYFDNEGNVIHYSVSFSEDKKTITFVSDVSSSAPRFRFIYRQLKDDLLGIEFDIAPPGKPDSFSKYVEGTARKK
jgi:hypothetical protein